jgi:hypothetical protein
MFYGYSSTPECPSVSVRTLKRKKKNTSRKNIRKDRGKKWKMRNMKM